ncbi:unnamed protein product [Cunninghamella blakesleeana]
MVKEELANINRINSTDSTLSTENNDNNIIVAPTPQARRNHPPNEKYLSVLPLNNIPSPASSAASSDIDINAGESDDDDSDEVTVITPPSKTITSMDNNDNDDDNSSDNKNKNNLNESSFPSIIIKTQENDTNSATCQTTTTMASSNITNYLISEKVPTTTAINTTPITTDSASASSPSSSSLSKGLNKNDKKKNKTIPNEYLRRGDSQVDILWNEMEEIQWKDHDDDFGNNDVDLNEELDDENTEDEELKKITEANRHIVVEGDDDRLKKSETTTIKIDDEAIKKNTNDNNNKPSENNETEYERVVRHYDSVKKRQKRRASIHTHIFKELLVFGDSSTEVVFTTPTEKSKEMIYGAGPNANQAIQNSKIVTITEDELKKKVYKRKYLVACDFSEESLYALEWTMGTILRDQDELHIVTVSNHEDNQEIAKEYDLNLEKEMDLNLDAAIEETKKRLSKMMLYDIKVVFHSMVGRVKDAIKSLIYNLELTMVICGCRGRGTMKGWIMGSVSTYLVHKSIVPVTVVRLGKKKKPHRRHLVTAKPLSESVRTGNLQVDELKE